MKRLVLVAIALTLTACGSNGPTLSTSPPSSPSPAVSPSPSPSPRRVPVRLTGDGVDLPDGLVEFGADITDVRARLVAALGEPSKDTGVGDSFSFYGTCPGRRLQGLEFYGGALRLLFGDVIGPGLTFFQWSLAREGQPQDAPTASAFVGDVTTYEFGVNTPLGDLRTAVAADTLKITQPQDQFPAGFHLTDQSAGFFGYLTGTGDTDLVTAVIGGEGCGE
ncbi:MAG: hypothetical protein ABIO67_07075 [Mycobacteriales bacterium]